MGVTDRSIRLIALENISGFVKGGAPAPGAENEKRFFEILKGFVDYGLSKPCHGFPYDSPFEYMLADTLKRLRVWITDYEDGKMINLNYHILIVKDILGGYERMIRHHD